jgi:putative salt-induced outer membrane protein YdiY
MRAVAMATGAACALLVLAPPARAQSVLNTERVDPMEVSGVFASVGAGATLQGGNASVVKLKGDGTFGFRGAHAWVELVAGLSYLSSSDSVSTDDRYLQLRFGRFLTARTRTFHFVQIQNSREQALAQRVLLGSGIRHDFVRTANTRLNLGAGLMWESERLDAGLLPAGTPATSHAWRGDFIGSAMQRVSSTTRLTDVLYVEPRLDLPGDLHAFNESHLLVRITSACDLDVGFQWLHDSRPPATVRPNDLELDTALSLTVK